MFRTNSFGIPSLVNQPRARQMRIVHAEDFERLAGDNPRLAPHNFSFLLAESLCRPARKDVRSPQNLVRHPIANSRKTFLSQQDRLDRRAAVPLKKAVEECVAKRTWKRFPGRRHSTSPGHLSRDENGRGRIGASHAERVSALLVAKQGDRVFRRQKRRFPRAGFRSSRGGCLTNYRAKTGKPSAFLRASDDNKVVPVTCLFRSLVLRPRKMRFFSCIWTARIFAPTPGCHRLRNHSTSPNSGMAAGYALTCGSSKFQAPTHQRVFGPPLS